MEVNDQCVGSFLSSLEEYVDFSSYENKKNLSNLTEAEVIDEFYNFANKSIYGKHKNCVNENNY